MPSLLMNKLRDHEAITLFGPYLRQLCQQQGLTMEDLACRSWVAYNQLGRIELGEINTTTSTVSALARGLQIRPTLLFEFELPLRPFTV